MEISRIGLIGFGKHGRRYAHHIANDFPNLHLHAIARNDHGRLHQDAREWSTKGFADYRELIEKGGCDAIVAVVPPHLNLDIVGFASEAGVPLLLEKPAAMCLSDGQEMLRLHRAKPTPVMVAQTLRYNAAVAAMVRHRSDIGRLTSLSLTQRFEPSDLVWLDDPDRAGAGVVLHTGVHSFDLVRHLSGLEIRRVTAQVSSTVTQRTEDSCAATLELDRGVLATVSVARTSGGRVGSIEIAGDAGVLIGDHVSNRVRLVRGREGVDLDVGGDQPTVRQILADFVSCLESGQAMPIPLVDGLRAVAVADACLESARSGSVAVVESPEAAI